MRRHKKKLKRFIEVYHVHGKPILVTRMWAGEGREAQQGGIMCIIVTDLHCCMAETNTTLKSNFFPIKK